MTSPLYHRKNDYDKREGHDPLDWGMKWIGQKSGTKLGTKIMVKFDTADGHVREPENEYFYSNLYYY